MKIGITFGHGVFPAGDGVRARGWESSRFEGDHLTQIGFCVTLPRIINRRDYIVWHHILKIMSQNDAIKRRNLILENSVVNLPRAQHYEQWCYLCSQLPGVLLLCREIGPKIDTLKIWKTTQNSCFTCQSTARILSSPRPFLACPQ